MKKVVKLGTGEVILNRPKRRRFTADYKLKILAEAEACKGTSQVAAKGSVMSKPVADPPTKTTRSRRGPRAVAMRSTMVRFGSGLT